MLCLKYAVSNTLANEMHSEALLTRLFSIQSRNQKTVASRTFYHHENGERNTVIRDDGEEVSIQKEDG